MFQEIVMIMKSDRKFCFKYLFLLSTDSTLLLVLTYCSRHDLVDKYTLGSGRDEQGLLSYKEFLDVLFTKVSLLAYASGSDKI